MITISTLNLPGAPRRFARDVAQSKYDQIAPIIRSILPENATRISFDDGYGIRIHTSNGNYYDPNFSKTQETVRRVLSILSQDDPDASSGSDIRLTMHPVDGDSSDASSTSYYSCVPSTQKELRERLTEKTRELDSLQRELAVLRRSNEEQSDESRARLENLTAEKARAESRVRELEDTRNRVAENSRRAGRFQAQVHDLRRQLAEANASHGKEVSGLREELAGVIRKRDAARAQIAELEQEPRLAIQESRVREDSDKMRVLEAKFQQLRDYSIRIEKEWQRVEARHETQLEQRQREIDALEARLRSVQNAHKMELRDLRAGFLTSEQKHEYTARKLQAAHQENVRLQAKYDEVLTRLRNVAAERSTLKARLLEVEDQNNDLELTEHKNQERIRELRVLLASLRSENVQYLKEKEQAEDSMIASQRLHQTTLTALEARKEQIAGNEAEIARLECELKPLEARTQRLIEEKAKAEQEAARLRPLYNEADARAIELEKENAGLMEYLALAKKTIENLNPTLGREHRN